MIRDVLILNMADNNGREKILDKIQLEGKTPQLDKVVGLLKHFESRK